MVSEETHSLSINDSDLASFHVVASGSPYKKFDPLPESYSINSTEYISCLILHIRIMFAS